MSKYLKLFENHSEYSAFTQTEEFVKPNVSHCISENEVHYNPLPIWGAVDLGLPSGTLWASMNVGAASETDYGLYFAWGETEGYTANDVTGASPTKVFSWGDYELSNGGTSGSNPKFTKYCPTGQAEGYYADGFTGDTLVTLEDSDDAAFVASGGQYRMPTKAQFEELIANTTFERDSERSGYTFTSTNGNTLFLPFGGSAFNGSTQSVGMVGYFWTSSLYSNGPRNAWCLQNVSIGDDDYYYRIAGYSIRGVLNQ